MKKINALLLIFAVGIMLAACTSEDGITFSDPKLEEAIRTELGQTDGDLHKEDVLGIEELDLNRQGISNLDGIENLENLEFLSLEGNDISSITPLLEMERLVEVNVTGNPLVNDEEQLALIEELIGNGIEVTYLVGRPDGPGGFLWKVENNGTTVYLQGTIHVGTRDFYPLHESIEMAYYESDVVVPEIDLNNLNLFEMQRLYAELGEYQDGSTIQDHIDEELYEKLEETLAEFGIPLGMVETYKPWFLTSLIQSLMLEQLGYLYGVDEYFLNKAQLDDKEVIALETAELQFGVLAGVSDSYQAEMLEESLISIEEYDEQLVEMMELYKEGDEHNLLDYLMVESEEEHPEAQAYMEALNDERNYGMAEKIVEFLESGDERTYFVIVGTLHYILEPHIVSILEAEGYQVDRIH